eukprot:3021889-Prorocentrum_lima.AAC.1
MEVPLVSPLKRLIEKADPAFSKGARAALRCIAAGGLWSRWRLWSHGALESPACPCCGALAT